MTGAAHPIASNSSAVAENASLKNRNTFGVDAHAAHLIELRDAAALPSAIAFAIARDLDILVLGAGSNVLLTRDWPGVVLAIETRGIEVIDDHGDFARIRVAAGENWDELVHWSLAHGCAGLENLVSIPGTVGAAPIQNIGAYGVEVGEFVSRVDAWDRAASRWIELDGPSCAFAYRDSIFKRERNRYVISAVELTLPRQRPLQLDYAGVREELAALGATKPTPSDAARAIAGLRARKLPDPARIGNAGSFFKNPILSPAEATKALAREPRIPHWPSENGDIKLSAAWLIEAAGMKGLRDGDAGISADHALVLVNHGHAGGAQLWTLATRVRDAVHAQFDVILEPEPLVI